MEQSVKFQKTIGSELLLPTISSDYLKISLPVLLFISFHIFTEGLLSDKNDFEYEGHFSAQI